MINRLHPFPRKIHKLNELKNMVFISGRLSIWRDGGDIMGRSGPEVLILHLFLRVIKGSYARITCNGVARIYIQILRSQGLERER